jgi:hypothetical protein
VIQRELIHFAHEQIPGRASLEDQGIFRNTVNFLKLWNVDVLKENRLGSRGSGLHHFGKCYRLSPGFSASIWRTSAGMVIWPLLVTLAR